MLDKAYDSACKGSRSFECTQGGCCKSANKPTMCTKSGPLGGFEGRPISVCTDNLRHPDELTNTADMLHELLRWWVGDNMVKSKLGAETRDIDRYRIMRGRIAICLQEIECNKDKK